MIKNEKDREVLVQAMYNEGKFFSTTLLSVTSGATALSVAIYSSLSNYSYECLIFISWSFYLISILFQVISHLISVKLHTKEIQILDNNSDGINPYTGYPTTLNYSAVGLFLISSVLFLIFISLN